MNTKDKNLTERRQVAMANRILYSLGVLDAFGHVSLRASEASDRFLLARSKAPGLVTEADIFEIDFNGFSDEIESKELYVERFIHSEIYRLRPDVNAIVHSHSKVVLPFTIVPGVPLRCVCHTAGFIKSITPNFDIRDFAGDGTDLLIRDHKLGSQLAKCLGDYTVVLMRGHGLTVVGSTLEQAVFNSVYTDVNAQVLAESLKLGAVVPLSVEEGKSCSEVSGAVTRAWDLWVSEFANL